MLSCRTERGVVYLVKRNIPPEEVILFSDPWVLLPNSGTKHPKMTKFNKLLIAVFTRSACAERVSPSGVGGVPSHFSPFSLESNWLATVETASCNRSRARIRSKPPKIEFRAGNDPLGKQAMDDWARFVDGRRKSRSCKGNQNLHETRSHNDLARLHSGS